jgi:LytS/YehU family sensor histidine kinase
LSTKLQADVLLKKQFEKIYHLCYRLDTTLQDEASALKHFLLATQWRDSIYNEQNRKKIETLQGRFETETTQNKIAMLEKENEVHSLRIQQSRILLIGMGGFVIIIVLMALLFIRQNKIKAEHKTVVLEQKLLRLQMNPHFIFNALSNILNLINRNNNPVASKYLTRFSKLLRNTLEGSRKDTIRLDDEIKGLENYLELQKLRFGEKFDFLIYVDEAIDTESTVIPPLLVQPFIENAIEHGIKHKKTKGHVFLRFLAKENQVVCEVEDDGVGREKAWELEYAKHKDHQSLATTIIKERIQNLNKNLKNKIRFNIIDLKSEDGAVRGTRVVIALPQ